MATRSTARRAAAVEGRGSAPQLSDAGYVGCTKSFESRKPVTRYRLTGEGRRALQRYIDHIEAVVRATRQSLEKQMNTNRIVRASLYFDLRSTLYHNNAIIRP